MRKLVVCVLVLVLVLSVALPACAKGPAPYNDGKAVGHEKKKVCRGSYRSSYCGQHDRLWWLANCMY